MKKIAALLTASALLISMSACRNRNTALRNDYTNPYVAQDGTNIGYQAGQQGQQIGQNMGLDTNQWNGNQAQGNGTTGQNNTGIRNISAIGADRQNNEMFEGTTQGIATDARYEDGIYSGDSKNQRASAVVIIRNNGMKVIDLKRVDERGIEMADGVIINGTSMGGGTNSTIGVIKSQLTNAMLNSQTNDVTTTYLGDMDVVNDWKEAVGNALEKAKKK